MLCNSQIVHSRLGSLYKNQNTPPLTFTYLLICLFLRMKLMFGFQIIYSKNLVDSPLCDCGQVENAQLSL